jgi:glycosyltransferase involved in cell wall biosynthesis
MVQDRKTGLLIPPNDIHALRAALEELMHDHNLRKTLGTAGKEFAAAELSWDSIAVKHRDFYLQFLERRNS